MKQTHRRIRLLLLLGLGLAVIGVTFSPAFTYFVGHQGKDPSYHNFADQRTLLGIPHCLNLLSNIPFVIVAILGIRFLLRGALSHSTGPIQEARERWCWIMLFIGVGLSGFGSAYYHWAPNNDTLVWDRLPM